jgi:hypothetical protein
LLYADDANALSFTPQWLAKLMDIHTWLNKWRMQVFYQEAIVHPKEENPARAGAGPPEHLDTRRHAIDQESNKYQA